MRRAAAPAASDWPYSQVLPVMTDPVVSSLIYDRSMSSSSEPLVESLTAEIRVLQVGSKPVTLSAARQLDLVNASEIKPFGRVRIDPKPVDGLIEVIGSVSGILARSSASSREVECPGYMTKTYSRSYGHPQAVCSRHRNTSPASGVGQRHSWTEYAPSQELYEVWLALPLIVLAGLR
jgi:hypothetical protein